MHPVTTFLTGAFPLFGVDVLTIYRYIALRLLDPGRVPLIGNLTATNSKPSRGIPATHRVRRGWPLFSEAMDCIQATRRRTRGTCGGLLAHGRSCAGDAI